MLTLCVKEPGGGSRELCIDCSPHTIGRGKSNDIVLSDHTVSNKHARITCENDQFSIEDLEGTGGVYLNNEKISEKTHIDAGATIKMGGTTMEVSLLATYEGKTMVMFSPDEDTPPPFNADVNSDRHGKEDPTVLMPEEENPTLREKLALKKKKPAPEKLPIRKTPVFYFCAITICLLIACLFYFQIRPVFNNIGKSEPTEKSDEVLKMESFSKPTSAQTRLKNGQDLAEGKNLETQQIVDNDKPIDHKETEKENSAAHSTRPERNDAAEQRSSSAKGCPIILMDT